MYETYTDIEHLDYVDGSPEDGYDLLGNEIDAGQECHACFGTGLDRDWDSDCLECYGDGTL